LAFFPVGQGVLDKDPNIWLGGARPSNTCIPPSFLGSMFPQLHGKPIPNKTFERYIKIEVKMTE
jgi:hypothetical protein